MSIISPNNWSETSCLQRSVYYNYNIFRLFKLPSWYN